MHFFRSRAIAPVFILLLFPLLGHAQKPPAEIGGKTLDEWIKRIGDRDPSIQQGAIRTVVNFGPPSQKAVPSLLRVLSDRDASVRADAAAALGMIPMDRKQAETAAKGLTRLLQDISRPVRIQAASSLASMGPVVATDITRRYLSFMLGDSSSSASWEVRKTAAYALGRLRLDPANGPNETAMKALIGALNDPCAAVRLESVMALSELGLSPDKKLVEVEKKSLYKRLNDSNKIVAVWTRVLLMFLDADEITPVRIGYLSKCLNDPDMAVRIQAVRAMGALGRADSKGKAKIPNILKTFPGLQTGLRDKDSRMIIAVLTILGQLGKYAEPAVPQVLSLMKDKELVVRCGAARALGTLGELAKNNLKDLEAALQDKEDQMVVSAILGLAQLGEIAKPSLPALKKLTASKNETIKQSAEAAIKQIEADRGE